MAMTTYSTGLFARWTVFKWVNKPQCPISQHRNDLWIWEVDNLASLFNLCNRTFFYLRCQENITSNQQNAGKYLDKFNWLLWCRKEYLPWLTFCELFYYDKGKLKLPSDYFNVVQFDTQTASLKCTMWHDQEQSRE